MVMIGSLSCISIVGVLNFCKLHKNGRRNNMLKEKVKEYPVKLHDGAENGLS